MRTTAFVLLLAAPAFTTPRHEGHEGHAPGSPADVTELARRLVTAVEAQPPLLPGEFQHSFDDPRRRTIDYFPLGARRDPRGLSLGLMGIGPRRATHALLRGILSEEGYLRTQAIRSLEDNLRATVVETSVLRIPDAYTVQVFGSPSETTPWAFKFEGHHLSINATVVDGQFRGTPLFLGVNPAEVLRGPDTGLRVLGPQEDLARTLVASLDAEQREVALRPEYDPTLAIPLGPLADPGEAAGLGAARMTETQRALLLRLVQSFARNLRVDFADAELQRIDAAGLESLRFLWRGSTSPGGEFSCLVQGPTVLIQLDSVVDVPGQPANHLHALWRDPERDFGADLLAQHHAEDHR